jgi:hypothetical protein
VGKENAYRRFHGKPEEGDHWEDVDIDRKTKNSVA